MQALYLQAAAEAIEACVNHCPHGVSFPMTTRRLDAPYADPFILVDLGTDHVTSDFTSQIRYPLLTGDCQSQTSYPVQSGPLRTPRDNPAKHDLSASLDSPRFIISHAPKNKSTLSIPCEKLQIRLRKVRELTDSHKKIGNILWISAISLGHWIIRNEQTTIAGKSVLEIGSGLGLCGIVAGRYARSVVMSDFDPVIVRNLEYNVRCNRHLLRSVSWQSGKRKSDVF